MANVRKFLDAQGVSTLWARIQAELNTKGENISALSGRVGTLETKMGTAEGKITNLEGLHATGKTVAQEVAAGIDALNLATTYAGKAYEGKVDTLIGNDSNKSVRTIANEELTAQLIPANAQESLDTLKEIAAWIQAHPGDATAMNSAITALQNKLTLGYKTGTTEYATVKAYVEAYVTAAIAGADLSQYALDSDLNALEKLVGDTAVATQIQNAITALNLANTYDAKGAAATAETNAKSYANGLAKNYATAAQGTKADRALQSVDITTGTVNGSIKVKGTNVAVAGLGSAAYTNTEAYATAAQGAKADTALQPADIDALTPAEIYKAIGYTAPSGD